MTLKFLILFFSSFSALAGITFENVSTNSQVQLIRAIEQGIPIYSGSFDTGEVSYLKIDNVTKIMQHGNLFSVCTGSTTLFEIKFKCFKSKPCCYITNGGVTKARFQLEQCLITSDYGSIYPYFPYKT